MKVKELKINIIILTLICFAFNAASELDSGLVSDFRFEEGSGDTTWANGLAYPIYHTGFNPWTAGKFGYGLHFNNTAYVQSNNAIYLDTVTISVWVKIDTITETTHEYYQGHDMTIVENNGGYKLSVYNDGTPYFQTSVYSCDPWYEESTRLIANKKIIAQTWTHILTISNGNGQELYINGSLVGTQMNPGPIRDCGGQIFTIGKHPVDFDPENFKGTIDNVHIYDRALNASEILQIACVKTIFVDSTATGRKNGTSWEDAYTDLKQALDSAIQNTLILVSKGTYFPSNSNDREVAFQLKQEVYLYGGYNVAIGDTTFTTRDWVNNQTILSGDIGVLGDSTDNTYHVIKGENNSIIDGFQIQNGNANYSNQVEYYLEQNNLPNDNGGGVYNDGVSLLINNCKFIRNNAAFGGAISNKNGGVPIITNCIFENNTSYWYGGAIMNRKNVSTNIYNCKFIENECLQFSTYTRGGGAICNRDTARTAIENCSFIRNEVTGYGGAIQNATFCKTDIINCSFTENTCNGYVYGGAIDNIRSCTTYVCNSIMWNDTGMGGREIYSTNNSGCFVKIKNCNITGGWNGSKVYPQTTILNMGGNINVDPLYNNTDVCDLMLQQNSLCNDAGDNEHCETQLDLAGNKRIADGNSDGTEAIDIGAYEFQP